MLIVYDGPQYQGKNMQQDLRTKLVFYCTCSKALGINCSKVSTHWGKIHFSAIYIIHNFLIIYLCWKPVFTRWMDPQLSSKREVVEMLSGFQVPMIWCMCLWLWIYLKIFQLTNIEWRNFLCRNTKIIGRDSRGLDSWCPSGLLAFTAEGTIFNFIITLIKPLDKYIQGFE